MSNPFSDEAGPQPPRVLKTSVEIYANLRPLLENHTPLLIHFTERNQRYQSYLIEIDSENGRIALDELMPRDGERLMADGEPFQIHGLREGIRLTWINTQPADISELDAALCYWLPTPDEILYHQRRNAYRAPLRGRPVVATLASEALGSALTGNLLDISATGCKLVLKGDQQSRLQTGQVYNGFRAQLPFGMIETAVELRHVIFSTKQNMTFCGMNFHRISGLTQRQIERFVYQLQREARRIQTGDRFA